MIGLARERYAKNLWSQRAEGQRPVLVNCEDDGDQATYVIRRILEHREAGIDLRRQAVLFRASHHSILLEAELARAGIPFHKYGGLKFIETAHVKDLMAFLRLAENPRDVVAGSRLLPLLPGVGPGKARQLMDTLLAAGGNFDVWADWSPPAAATKLWPKFIALLKGLVQTADELPAQLNRVRKFYTPLLEAKYDHVEPRLRDLEQLELIASRYRSRARMLLEITLDPPSSTQDLAGPPRLDDDFLVLSTIHSAKGLEWDAVYVIHAADGNIPSDMATKNPEEIEEERRLFYVALTRAKNWLYVCYPLRYYYPGRSDRHSFAQRTRFLPERLLKCFEQCVTDHAGRGGRRFRREFVPPNQPQRPPADEGLVGVTLADHRRIMERMMKGNRKKPKRSNRPYWEMTTAELREATKEFDREFVGETFRPMTPQERAQFERARKRGRPRNGLGAKTISVTVEKRLLAQADRLAKKLQVPLAVLIARGLQTVVNAEVPV